MNDHFLTQVEKLAAIGRSQDLQFDGVVARVTVDQFCSLNRPTQAEIERFAAVMVDALPQTDPASAARIAEKLAAHPATPELVLSHVAKRGAAAAAAVFRLAPRLSTALLLARAETGDCAEAVAIAGRRDLDAPVVAALARRAEPEALRALAANQTAHISHGALIALIQRGRFDEALARALLSRADLGSRALPLFLFADSRLRRQMILEAERAELARAIGSTSSLAAARQAALSAARAANRNAFATAIAVRLKCGRATIDRMIDDAGGEPLALIFAATGADRAVAADAMSMLRPGQTLDALPNVRLARETTPLAAFRILSAVVGHGSVAHTGEYDIVSAGNVTNLRAGAVDRIRKVESKLSRG